MIERNSPEIGSQMLLERPPSDPASARGEDKPYDSASNETLRLRSPLRQDPPLVDRASPQPPFEADDEREPQERNGGDEIRKSWFRRHPTAFALGLLFMLPATSAGYLYWDYARHFETTDDAFIAARQFDISPEVSGYITAVPVTDNQHVAAGAVIARIDDRNYRIALAEDEAQV